MKRASHSYFSIAFDAFKRNKWAMFCCLLILILYSGAIFAGFLAPYHYSDEDRALSYAPPTSIHIINNGRLTKPFVYGTSFYFNENKERIYIEDKAKVCTLRFFAQGEDGLRLLKVDPPCKVYLLGADSRGRDILSRLLYGARISLSIGLIGVAISFSIGLIVGGIAGYYGGTVDNILMRLCEMFMLVPGFYLMLALRSAVPDTFNSFQIYLSIVVILSFIGWASLARIIRGMSISLRERDYVLAAKILGLSDFKIIIKHILPHTLSYSIVAIMLSIPGYILGEAALSLIGLGIQDPLASWGNMLSDAMGIAHIYYHPWILLPGFFIFLTVMAFNVVGDGLRDALDPLMKEEGV